MENTKEIKIEQEIKEEKEKIYYSLYLTAKTYMAKYNEDSKTDDGEIYGFFMLHFEELIISDNIHDINVLKAKLEEILNKLIELKATNYIRTIYSILNNTVNFVYGTGQ